MNPLRKLISQTAIYGMGTIVPRLLNYFLLTPFYTRIFLQGEYGVITELYAYMAFLLVLMTYGMETTFFRFAEREPDTRKVFSTSLFSLFITSSLFILLVLLFAQPIASVIKYPDNKSYIILFSLIVSIDAFSAIPFVYLRQQNKAFRFSMLKIINVMINVGLNFFFLWLCPRVLQDNPDSWVRLVYNENIGVGYAFIANLAASAVTMLLLLPEIRQIKPQLDTRLLKRMLTYALPLLVVGLAGMVNEVSDKIIFKYLLIVPEGIEDPDAYVMAQLGIYGASYKLAVLMTLFIQMFRFAAEPFFFSQAKEENAKEVYADVMKYFVIFGLFIFLGVMFYLDVVKYFIGPDFWEGLFIVPLILLANLFMGIAFNLSMWYKLNDMTRYGAFIALVGAVVTIGLNILLVPKFSYLGAAWGHFGTYLVMVILSYYWGQKYYTIHYPLGRIAFYFVLAISLFLVSYFLPVTNPWIMRSINAIFLIVYITIVYLIERKSFKAVPVKSNSE
jgi:O-antigen/teichoic acid export membrane protein